MATEGNTPSPACTYRLPALPADIYIRARYTTNDPVPTTRPYWCGQPRIPAIGERVNVRVNGYGPGVVTAYFLEHGYLGVHVDVQNPPDWARKQWARDGKTPSFPGFEVGVFGSEIDLF